MTKTVRTQVWKLICILSCCWWTSFVSGQEPACVDHLSCTDYAMCENSTCVCLNGFYFNSTRGECQANITCTAGHLCSDTCAEVEGTDQCFCPHGHVLHTDGYTCLHFFRFGLEVLSPYCDQLNNTHYYAALQTFLRTALSSQDLQSEDVIGAAFLSKYDESQAIVVMRMDFTSFTPAQLSSLETAIGEIIHSDNPSLLVDDQDVPILNIDVYTSPDDAVNDDNPLDISMCSFAHPCNLITETCVDLRGTAFHCVSRSHTYRYFRGLAKTPYNESNFDQLFIAIANLTENFLRAAASFYSPVELLTFQPENDKADTAFVVYSDAFLLFNEFQSAYIEQFYLTDVVEIILKGTVVDVERIQMFNSPQFAVQGIYHMPIAVCGTKYSHCPWGIDCIDHYNGTYNCRGYGPEHYLFVHYGYWRALVDVPFMDNSTENVSITVAQRIQTFLGEDLYLGPITVTALNSGEEDGMTFVVLEIGFAIQSYNNQKYYIHHGFVMQQATFDLIDENGTISTHRFEYVKFYQSSGDALQGGAGQIINDGCTHGLCPTNTECIATDFRFRCEPYCDRGLYTDGQTCASCARNKTTFYNGTHFPDLCILQCPENEEYNIFTMECHECPENSSSPEGDPRCYFCNTDIENVTDCNDETVTQGLDDVVDISIAMTLSYAKCPHLQVSDAVEINITHFILELITSHGNDPFYNGVCFMHYKVRTAAHCENAVVELQSEVCEPDESCVPNEVCHRFSTNLTLTIYNTLSKYAVVETTFFNQLKYKYLQSAESAIAESLFDHSQLYRSFEGDQMNLDVTFRDLPKVTHLTKEEAEERHVFVGVFYKDGLDINLVHDILQIEISIRLKEAIADFLYFQVESSWHFGSHLDNLVHFALVFKDGADQAKVNVTAEVLLNMHDSVGGTTRNMSILTGPISIHLSSDAIENTVEWCTVRDRMSKPYLCPYPTECHNYHVLEKSHDLVECSAPGISKVFMWIAIEKPYNEADDEAMAEHLVELFNELLMDHGLDAHIIFLDARHYSDGETLAIIEADFTRSFTDSDLTSISIFAYQYFIVTHHTVHLSDSSSFNVTFFEVFLSRKDAWHGHNALVHQLCNATITGFTVCPNDSICIDTTQGPHCIGLCQLGSYHDGNGCWECPENTTNLLWGAESVDECFEKCVEGDGFDYPTQRCIPCPSGFVSKADQQFCFHENSSDVFPVDISIRVNVTLTNCDLLHELNPYDFNLGASRFVRQILTNRKHGYILRGVCYPEDCGNVKVTVESQDGRPICRLSPSCTDPTGCITYQMLFTIDITGADNLVLVHDTDTLRRNTSEVMVENMAFALQRSQNTALVTEHGVKFQYQTMTIETEVANEL